MNARLARGESDGNGWRSQTYRSAIGKVSLWLCFKCICDNTSSLCFSVSGAYMLETIRSRTFSGKRFDTTAEDWTAVSLTTVWRRCTKQSYITNTIDVNTNVAKIPRVKSKGPFVKYSSSSVLDGNTLTLYRQCKALLDVSLTKIGEHVERLSYLGSWWSPGPT